MTDYTPTIVYFCGIPTYAHYRGEVRIFEHVDAGEGRACFIARFTDMAQVAHHPLKPEITVHDPCSSPSLRRYTCPARKRSSLFSGEGTCVLQTSSTVSTPAPPTAGTRM